MIAAGEASKEVGLDFLLSLFFNRPEFGDRLICGVHREANKTTTTTLLTDVAAEGVKFHWGTASDWRAPDTGAGVSACLPPVLHVKDRQIDTITISHSRFLLKNILSAHIIFTHISQLCPAHPCTEPLL